MIFAHNCQEKFFACSKPAEISFSRNLEFIKILETASAIALVSSGLTRTAALPATSGMLVVFEVVTGHPHCIASRTGRPKPSYNEG